MTDISGFGLEVTLVASNTFPGVGFTITEFADDADPFMVEALTVGGAGMGVNGDLVTWTEPNPIQVTINIIPDSPDDINLSILAEANRPAKGSAPILDRIDITRTYNGLGGQPLVLTNGKIITTDPVTSVLQNGRKKTKAYVFVFEGKVGIA